MLVVTMPAHNEEATIREVLLDVRRHSPADTIIAVVCDHCTDGTFDIAEELADEVTENHLQPGLAATFRAEMTQVLRFQAEAIVHIDSDGQYDAADIPRLLWQLERGADLVVGNRFGSGEAEMRTRKLLLNNLGSFMYSLLLDTWIPDITSGFRAFRPRVARLPSRAKYTYTQEQVYRAIKAGYHLSSVTVDFRHRRRGDTSRLIRNPLQYLVRSATDFWRFAL